MVSGTVSQHMLATTSLSGGFYPGGASSSRDRGVLGMGAPGSAGGGEGGENPKGGKGKGKGKDGGKGPNNGYVKERPAKKTLVPSRCMHVTLA